MTYHHSEMSLEDKEAILRDNFKGHEASSDLVNVLFFAARSGVIAGIILDVERYFAERKLRVRAEWVENSFHTYFQTVLVDKYDHERHHTITRDAYWPRTGAPSDMQYSLKEVSVGDYYGKRKPVIAERFDEVLASEEFRAFLENQILRANYPFGYTSYSPF